MAKRGKISRLRTLPLDLSAMAGEPLKNVSSVVDEAYSTTVRVFDSETRQAFVASGKAVAPMGKRAKVTPSGITLTIAVAPNPLSIRDLDVRPGLDVDTTGRNRQPVRVTGKKSLTVEVPRGFVWHGAVFMRRENSRKIDNAKRFLVRSGADPSPARMLGDSQREVVEAATSVFLGAIDNAGKNRQ